MQTNRLYNRETMPMAYSAVSSPGEMPSISSPCTTTTQFPWRLHEMLNMAEQQGLDEIVSWLPHGKSFKVHDPKRFEKSLMKECFNQTKYKSFQRQLNLWGFHRNNNVDPVYSIKGTCSHPFFQRNNRSLCSQISRIGKNRSKVTEEDTAESTNSTISDITTEILTYKKKAHAPSPSPKIATNATTQSPEAREKSTVLDVAMVTSSLRSVSASSSPPCAFVDVTLQYQHKRMLPDETDAVSMRESDRALKRTKLSHVRDNVMNDQNRAHRSPDVASEYHAHETVATMMDAIRRRSRQAEEAILREKYLRETAILERLRFDAAITLVQQQRLEQSRKLALQELNASTASTRMHLIASALASPELGSGMTSVNGGSTSTIASTAIPNTLLSGGTMSRALRDYEMKLLRRLTLAGTARTSTSSFGGSSAAATLARILGDSSIVAKRFPVPSSMRGTGQA